MIKQDRQTRARINPHLKAALKVFVPLRIMASLWAVIIISLFPATTEIEHVPTDLAVSAPHDSALSTWLIKPWFRWDTQWYTAIARNGYERPGSTTFLPFYPLLTGLLGRMLAGEYLLAALIISNLAAVIALALLHKLVSEHYGRRSANYTLAYIALFPTSFYLVAGYTESLFLALVLGAFLLAERERWLLAGLCAILAIFTRWQGAALIPAMAIYMLRNDRRALVALGLIPLALIGVLAIFVISGGVEALPWRQLQTEQAWQGSFTWPWRAWAKTGLALVGQLPDNKKAIRVPANWVLTAVFYALLVKYMRHGIIPYTMYAWGAHLMTASRLVADSTLRSMPRYVLVLFPAFVLLAGFGKRHIWFNKVYVYISMFMWLILCSMFVLWYWPA